MNRFRRCTIIIICTLGLLTLVMVSGCGIIGFDLNDDSIGSGSSQQPQPSHTEQEMPSTETLANAVVVLPEILVPTASGVAVEENGEAVIDFSNKQDGYIMAKYLEPTDLKVKLLIMGPDGVQYTYAIHTGRDFEVFPLSSGNGTYEVGVFKQVEGTRYAMVLSTTIDVTLVDEFAPFLRPNQFVNFDQNSNAVLKAAELTAGKIEFMDRVSAIYHYVITHIIYDIELAETVQNDYLPDVDRILASGKGICFDYAALMSAMLRSQEIPTKLVIGYAGEQYHAWISVYCKEDGWLDNVIHFDGHNWELVDPTFAASGSASNVAQYIGDGQNYTVLFVH